MLKASLFPEIIRSSRGIKVFLQGTEKNRDHHNMNYHPEDKTVVDSAKKIILAFNRIGRTNHSAPRPLLIWDFAPTCGVIH